MDVHEALDDYRLCSVRPEHCDCLDEPVVELRARAGLGPERQQKDRRGYGEARPVKKVPGKGVRTTHFGDDIKKGKRTSGVQTSRGAL